MSKVKFDIAHAKEVLEANSEAKGIVVTSDGTIFLDKHKSFAENHAREFKLECETLTREELEAMKTETSKEGTGAGKTPTAPTALTDENWKEGKAGQIMEYAASKGLSLTSKLKDGKDKIIAEVETLLAAAK